MSLAASIVMCLMLATSAARGQDASDAGSAAAASGGSSIPGAQTVTGILATSADGVSRYLAPDGPIQPALTAIGGLPLRAVELANSGITGVSSGMDSMANSVARAGGNEQIAMPGLAALQSVMPSPLGSLGNMASSMIQTKNRVIMGQANAGIDAGNRLRSAMEQGLNGNAAAAAASASQRRRKRQADMATAETGQHKSMMMSQMSNGLQGVSMQATGALEQGTASQLSRQLQSGLQQNMQMAGGVMGQMQGNMGGLHKEAENMMGQMQNGLAGAIGQVQNVAEQGVKSLHKSATGLLDNFSNMASSMMQGGKSMGGASGGSSGRY